MDAKTAKEATFKGRIVFYFIRGSKSQLPNIQRVKTDIKPIFNSTPFCIQNILINQMNKQIAYITGMFF